MEPETPPRRKKAGREPVTIDLDAAPATASNEAVADPAPQSEEMQTEKADDPIVKEADREAEEISADAEARYEPDNTAGANETQEPPSVAPASGNSPRQTGSAGAFAAGILGGLIALLGAGSLQYGGYLPSLGPQQSDSAVALAGEVEALKARLAEIPATPPAIDLQPLEERVANLESSLASSQPSGTSPETLQTLSTLETAVAKLDSDVTALREELATTARTSNEAEARLTERLSAAEQKLDEPRSDIEMARAVSATALKTAIDRGGPYLAELDAFASVSPDDPSIPALREHAAVGVSARSDLIRDFPDAADRILSAIHQPDGDQGIINRLMTSAVSSIRIRPVGSVEGDTPEATVARMENKLQNGDFKGAQLEWQTLPENGRNAASEFKAALDQRIAVEDLIGKVVSGAVATSRNQVGE
ncbi:MAG: hypothetical protein QHC90_17430 [Shinella sp.]|nr:hypothetical protein [Shinella sp.]